MDILTVLIADHPAGFSEHQLLTLLQQPPYSFFAENALSDPLLLFQTHFLLFHCLYRLRGQWLKNGSGMLNISALQIIKVPIPSAALPPSSASDTRNTDQLTDLESADPLAHYYLDSRHFSATTSADVDALLTGFWRKLSRPVASESVEQALQILQLSPPISMTDLKVQYRRLAQQYHPDKGGDSEHFKHICRAYHQLKQYDLSAL